MMGKVIMSGIVPQLVAPKEPGIALADIAEGSIVKLNEGGSPVEFYVAKHDYESGQNGTGRTLLVRKDIRATSAFGETSADTYVGSELERWMKTYAASLNQNVVNAIATTAICVSYSGSTTPYRYEQHAVFPLSAAEYGDSYFSDGTKLPVADLISVAQLNGVATDHWTRSTTSYSGLLGATYITSDGKTSTHMSGQGEQLGARPAFTLPSTTVFDEETLLFKGVS